MITKADILAITAVTRTEELVKKGFGDELPTAYEWDPYKGAKLCNPLKAEFNKGLLTLS